MKVAFQGCPSRSGAGLHLAVLGRRVVQLGRYVPQAKRVMYIDLHSALAGSTQLINVENADVVHP